MLEKDGIHKDNAAYVATGYGRISVPYADKSVTEITCHGKGAWHLFGRNGTVIDIGGQDTKGIALKNGRVMKFIMNDKCSAGTGKFLEVMTNRLGLTMEDIKEAQKQAAVKKASGKSGAQASGQKNGSNAANTAKKREEQKGKTVRVHNTNTAMGKALAAAMGGVTFDNSAEASAKKVAPAVQNASNDAKDISGLEKRIKNKKLLAEELGIGEITLTDILKELEKPGRDPRDDMPRPILRSDVLDMKDLKPGMILKGTVRNVIDFGVFVDIGVHQDGLVHISQITDRYIKHPLEAVSVGDIVDVQVLTVDMAKKRIGLTMKIQKQ